MLRPATPLSVLLLAALILLLLSVLSVPVTQSIALGKFNDVLFGVFGYCKGGTCSSIGIGYDTGKLVDADKQSFTLPTGVRNSLSAILVVHPIATAMTLAMFILAVIAHLHAPSRSSKYLLVLFLFMIVTFLLCLLAFVIDVLMFMPHLAWGSYLVLAASIVVGICIVVSFAMRRAVVGRKSRQKRIAENAEMSGENYYNREEQSKPTFVTTPQPTMPVISGGSSSAADSLPTFATFESDRKPGQVSEERIPLTQRNPAEKMANGHANNDMAAYAVAGRSTPASEDGRRRMPMNGPSDPYAAQRPATADRNRGRGDLAAGGAYAGRGGAYGRGGAPDGYGRPPPPPNRGGYGGPPGRGGPYGGRGYGSPPQHANGGRGGRGPPPNYANGPAPYDYGHPSDASLNRGHGGYDAYGSSQNLPRAESPPPLGGPARGVVSAGAMAEMDAGPARARNGYVPYGPGDADVPGIVGLQQPRAPTRHDTMMTYGSKYSTDEAYPSPRNAWNQDSGRSTPQAGSMPPKAEAPARRAPGQYYEDVDPRFTAPTQSNNQSPSPPDRIYDDMRDRGDGTRSPTASERSNFTSISQRGVNPRWNPNHPPMPRPVPGGTSRHPVQQRQDMILDNPDFQLPGNRQRPANRAAPGMIPGSAYPPGPM
ncbi:hypothetical protein DCS_00942 [Drechmeria coniospora]|uniref:PH-response regulator protein palI/rim-9 n=1 Tax=Drechmeria coniospora TaxID=98403 RepID=A0A151GRW1_DRECN|nr:hypothetical protein DCS_00942 [Drechmeria coniospora]KYK59808.1 hypothetical protein DCS_00942 [Drechmeria coniospora]